MVNDNVYYYMKFRLILAAFIADCALFDYFMTDGEIVAVALIDQEGKRNEKSGSGSKEF